MKKSIIASVFATVLATQAWGVQLTVSPTATVVGLLQLLVAAPTASSAGSSASSEMGKDQIALAKADAKMYLDHGVMSDDLADLIGQLRQMGDLSQHSDAEIALDIFTFEAQ